MLFLSLINCSNFIATLDFYYAISFSKNEFVGRAASAAQHLVQCAQDNQFIDVAQGRVG